MNGNDPQLVLRDFPIGLYIFGLIFAGFGAFAFFESGQLMVLIFLVIGLGVLIFTNALTIRADRITRTLNLEYRSALFRSQKQFSFDEISGIGVQLSFSRNSRTYKVVMKLKDGRLIPFRSFSSSGSRKKERLAAALREFISVPNFDSSTAGMTYAALDSYIGKTHETDGVHWQIQPAGAARWHSPDFKSSGFFLCVTQKAEGQASGGFLASLGSMIYKQVLSKQFQPDDTPGLDRAVGLAPLDPALEPHYMAFTSDPDQCRKILNPETAALLMDWAMRYPLKQLRKPSAFGQLTVLFSPKGVYLAPMNPLQPDQVNELAALGARLVISLRGSRSYSIETS